MRPMSADRLHSAAVTLPPASAAYVRRLSHDVLHRSPRGIEVRSLAGMPVDRVAEHCTQRLEAMQQWLEEELFYFLLIDAFRPRTAAIEALPERLRSGAADARAAIAEIVLSTSFSLRNPGNDTFVTVLLEQCLGIEVQSRENRKTLATGKRIYDGEPGRFLGRDARTQADLVRIVLEDELFARHLLDRHHRRLFGAGLDELPKGDAATVTARVHEAPAAFFDVLAEWLASERYVAGVAIKKPRTDRQFVRSLYMDVLEREPTYDEIRNVRNALQSMADATPLRAVMVKLVLGSREAKLPALGDDGPEAFVRDCFVRYLGRQPGQSELAGFVAALAEPGTDPSLVVRALLASPEYGFC